MSVVEYSDRPGLLCLRGYPASGKTRIARGLASTSGAKVIGRDFLRHMMFDSYTPGMDAEEAVTVAQQAAVRELLKAGHDVIIDDCNVNSAYLKAFRLLARDAAADFQVFNVPVDVETCVERDAARGAAGGRLVGEAVIRKMAKRFPIKKWPTIEAKAPMVIKPVEFAPGLPNAVIFDIDGTLAHMAPGPSNNTRSPYDYTRVHEDALDESVYFLNQEIASSNFWAPRDEMLTRIIILSGRDDACRVQTEKWLGDNGIAYDDLYMRPAELVDNHGNKPSDVIVKYDLFNEHLRGRYNVRFVVDDRNSVVQLWRDMGLKCLQAQPGAF